MTYLNARTKNTGNNEGDVYQFFANEMSNLIQKNGGDNHFNWFTQEAFEQTAPHPVNTKTNLRLTSSNFHITQFEKSFITVKLDLQLGITHTGDSVDYADDVSSLCQVFVGLKNSAEFFFKLDTICNNQLLKNTQDDAIREQFAYNCIKGRAQKTTAKFSHSLWENVKEMSPSVCGVYVPIKDFYNTSGTVAMELTIPYTDFLKYQAFQLYPNAICGELLELVQTSTDAFVWAPIRPSVVKEHLEFLTGTPVKYSDTVNYTMSDTTPITRKFTQIGQPGLAAHFTSTKSNDVVTAVTQDYTNITVSIHSATIQTLRTNIAGFNVKPDVLEHIRDLLRTPILIPSQTLDRRHFAQAAKPNGIDATTDIALNNVTNITVMFPRSTSDTTCFENIMYQNVQLSINKLQYPDTEVTTLGSRFYQMQLVANELDGSLEASPEFEDSFTRSLNAEDGTRYALSTTDATSFGINFQLERSNAGYVFDGIDTGSKTVPIGFRGQPLYSGSNDTYYNVMNPLISTSVVSHPPAPELWICQDTHFRMSVDGLEYMGPVTPPGFA